MVIPKIRQKGKLGFHIPESVWPKLIAEYEAGWSLAVLAKRIGTTHRTLAKKFRERGIEVRGKGRILGKDYSDLITRARALEHQIRVEQWAKEAELMDITVIGEEELLIDEEL